jgi:hypothetical protein
MIEVLMVLEGVPTYTTPSFSDKRSLSEGTLENVGNEKLNGETRQEISPPAPSLSAKIR